MTDLRVGIVATPVQRIRLAAGSEPEAAVASKHFFAPTKLRIRTKAPENLSSVHLI